MSGRRFRWRKWNNILHRDIGYLVFGMTVVYALSGIALNHIADWNPSYLITREDVAWTGAPPPAGDVPRSAVLGFLDTLGERDGYKKHYRPALDRLKIFIDHGSIELDTVTGRGVKEIVRRRPVFYEVNWLHYNPRGWWTWLSDLFSGALILVSITGLFVLKGRQGITGRGAWLTGIGVALPLGFLLLYL